MSKMKIVLGLIIASFLVLVGVSVTSRKEPETGKDYTRADILEMAKAVDLANYQADSIIAASEDNGNIGAKVVGEEDAPIVVYEYADYACPHCAEWFQMMGEKLEKEYKGKVKVVFRDYILNFDYSVETAMAANAAAMQGYWQPFAELVFANQNTWYYSSAADWRAQMVEYFKVASDGKGDVKQFLADMKSESAAKRLAFNYKLGESVELTGTPTFRLNGEKIDLKDLISTVDEEVAKLKK